jgi:hypothetical protein
MDDCKNYFFETGRRVSFEYTLLGTSMLPTRDIKLHFCANHCCFLILLNWIFSPAGINDEKEHVEELAELLRTCGSGYHVNLIPYNPIEGSEYKRPYRKMVGFLSRFLGTTHIKKCTYFEVSFDVLHSVGSSVCWCFRSPKDNCECSTDAWARCQCSLWSAKKRISEESTTGIYTVKRSLTSYLLNKI